MKYLYVAMLFCIGIAANSCKTVEPATAAAVPETASTVIAPAIQTVEIRSWKLEGYSLSFSDNSVSEIAVFQFDNAGNVLVEEHFDGQNALVMRKTGTMSGPGLYETVTFDGEGVILGKSLQTIKDDLVMQETLLDAKDAVQSTQQNRYDAEGRKTGSTISMTGGGEVTTAYIYQNGALSRSDILDASGTVINSFVRTYEAGFPSKDEQFDAQGRLLAATFFSYDRGFPVKEVTKNGTGSIQSITELVNDAEGNPVEIRYLDRNGTLLEVRKQKWKLFTRTVVAK
jgi:hypothetical protein